jgi:hypothetical protein
LGAALKPGLIERDATEPPLCERDSRLDLVDRQYCIGRIFFIMPDDEPAVGDRR